MRHLPTIARILLGFVFFASGLAGFLMKMPPDMPEFGQALMKTGYMFQFIKSVEVLVGLMLLANRFVPLALAILAPIMINIVAFHLFLDGDRTHLLIPLVLAALQIYLAWAYRDTFGPMLAVRATPNALQK